MISGFLLSVRKLVTLPFLSFFPGIFVLVFFGLVLKRLHYFQILSGLSLFSLLIFFVGLLL